MAFTHVEAGTFLSSSSVANIPNRLQKRFQAIFETRPELWQGKRVLDLGSHDGRWSYAALKMGAAHVTGVEGRPSYLASANTNMRRLQVDSQRYFFADGDALSYMRMLQTDRAPGMAAEFDIVLCLGFLYHTYNTLETLQLMAGLSPQTIIIDSVVNKGERMSCLIKREDSALDGNSIPNNKTIDGWNYVSIPSVPFIRNVLSDLGYGFSKVPWAPFIQQSPIGLPDYQLRRRMTAICEKRAPGEAKPLTTATLGLPL